MEDLFKGLKLLTEKSGKDPDDVVYTIILGDEEELELLTEIIVEKETRGQLSSIFISGVGHIEFKTKDN